MQQSIYLLAATVAAVSIGSNSNSKWKEATIDQWQHQAVQVMFLATPLMAVLIAVAATIMSWLSGKDPGWNPFSHCGFFTWVVRGRLGVFCLEKCQIVFLAKVSRQWRCTISDGISKHGCWDGRIPIHQQQQPLRPLPLAYRCPLHHF